MIAIEKEMWLEWQQVLGEIVECVCVCVCVCVASDEEKDCESDARIENLVFVRC